MSEDVLDKLKKWVKDNYKQYNTGWTYERSEGNFCDCFDDGFESALSWAAYDIGCILGIELKQPDNPDES